MVMRNCSIYWYTAPPREKRRAVRTYHVDTRNLRSDHGELISGGDLKPPECNRLNSRHGCDDRWFRGIDRVGWMKEGKMYRR